MSPWTGDAKYRLAPALLTLLGQLERAYPGKGWLGSPQTGTIGDIDHLAEGWTNSDHNPWLANTVRALDVAANVSGVPGIVTVTDAPDCEALFRMVNGMYAARDPRVWPNGYAIYLRRVTDWSNPGGYHAQVGDPHLYHLHISVSQNPAGYNSTAAWPLPNQNGDEMTEDDWKRLDTLLQTKINNALTSQRNWINWAYGPEVLGSTQRQHDNTLALAGQINTLHGAELDAIKASGGGPVDAAAVQAAAKAGAAEALNGVAVTSTATIHQGGTGS
jgi:hypothetical protein